MHKAFYNINEMAAILGLTVAAVYGHLSRKNFAAIPPPTYLGRRLAWPVDIADDWIKRKTASALDAASEVAFVQSRIGRPTKEEARRKRRGFGAEPETRE